MDKSQLIEKNSAVSPRGGQRAVGTPLLCQAAEDSMALASVRWDVVKGGVGNRSGSVTAQVRYSSRLSMQDE